MQDGFARVDSRQFFHTRQRQDGKDSKIKTKSTSSFF